MHLIKFVLRMIIKFVKGRTVLRFEIQSDGFINKISNYIKHKNIRIENNTKNTIEIVVTREK